MDAIPKGRGHLPKNGRTSGSASRKRPKNGAFDGAQDSGRPALECRLGLDFQGLLDDGTLSDVTLSVVGEDGSEVRSFDCHRVILAASSAYFRAIFTSDCRESTERIVKLTDVDAEALESIITLSYGATLTLSHTNAVSLLQAAEFYGISDLREKCTSFFRMPLSADAYYELLGLATNVRCETAQQLCIRALARDFAVACRHPSFLFMTLDCLQDMLKDDGLVAGQEEEVLAAVARWVEAGGDAEESARRRSADVLDDLLPLVRWPLMSTAVLGEAKDSYSCFAACTVLDTLLLQAFRFRAASAIRREAMTADAEADGAAFRLRAGMQPMEELLPAGLVTDMTFVWNIPGFTSINDESIYSPVALLNGFRWSLFLWPRRLCVHAGVEQEFLSIYLNSVDVKEGRTNRLPVVPFDLTLKNYKHSSLSITRQYEHAFDRHEVDWGLRKFISYEQVADPNEGFLNGGVLTIMCSIHPLREDEVTAYPLRPCLQPRRSLAHVAPTGQGGVDAEDLVEGPL